MEQTPLPEVKTMSDPLDRDRRIKAPNEKYNKEIQVLVTAQTKLDILEFAAGAVSAWVRDAIEEKLAPLRAARELLLSRAETTTGEAKVEEKTDEQRLREIAEARVKRAFEESERAIERQKAEHSALASTGERTDTTDDATDTTDDTKSED